jgi:hypothetical protein
MMEEVVFNFSTKLPNPAFDVEMQTIAHIEYLLEPMPVATKMRILRFVEDRINQKE